MLIELAEEHTTEMNTEYYPGSGPSWRGKNPYVLLLVVCIACRGYWLQGELEELRVATMAIALDLHLPMEPEGEPVKVNPRSD